MAEDKINIEITKKDKIYLSIISVLVLTIFCLAIVLPRPYKIVEVESPKYEKVYQKVYETERTYIINPSSSLFDVGVQGYVDTNGDEYGLVYKSNYLDTGKLKAINVSVKRIENGNETTKSFLLDDSIMNIIVENADFPNFGVEIEIHTATMGQIYSKLKEALGEGNVFPLDYYLLEIEFEEAVVNIIVSYIHE